MGRVFRSPLLSLLSLLRVALLLDLGLLLDLLLLLLLLDLLLLFDLGLLLLLFDLLAMVSPVGSATAAAEGLPCCYRKIVPEYYTICSISMLE